MEPVSPSTQLKQSHVPEKPTLRKKVKEAKTSVDPIMLTKGDLFDIGETIRDVPNDTFEELMTEQTTVLGVLIAHLQELQV